MAPRDKRAARSQMEELLAALPEVEMKKEKLAPGLDEIPLETQLFTLAGLSLEKETAILKDVLAAARES